MSRLFRFLHLHSNTLLFAALCRTNALCLGNVGNSNIIPSAAKPPEVIARTLGVNNYVGDPTLTGLTSKYERNGSAWMVSARA